MKYCDIKSIDDYKQYERERQRRRYQLHKNEILLKKKARQHGIVLTDEEIEAARKLDRAANADK